ncbi:MAG TPA: Gfo/Idh/MocA family oxidoreductase [Candidatus Brocadiia bacterium]|nr:Gfo/Idh/MocA family oxidoreductase [Candidatus Brocadiia bacterium]
MSKVRLGVIGVGGMGGSHARKVLEGAIKRMELAAVCDSNAGQLKAYEAHPAVKRFTDAKEMYRSGAVDAVLIATPHYSHTTLGAAALSAGLHTLVEKPISVHKADCERLIAAHKNPKLVFAAMFNQRTDPRYRKLKSLIEAGELGKITRVNWIITTWFRSDAYYASGGWRATWKGEGGGVLLNQCPHQLDLMQWLFGMPQRVRAFCHIGKFHNIEVEDEVTAYLEYATGATGVFITSTGEAPGTNRLEVTGDRGRIILEPGAPLRFTRNEVPTAEFCRTTQSRFGVPPVWNVEIPVEGAGGQHAEILQNFADAILDGAPLLAPASEGIRSVELGNAMLLSSMEGKTVDLPMNSAKFERLMKKLIRESRFQK